MKNIVVAVDFSGGSIHALKYAIKIANSIGANIFMIWVDKTFSQIRYIPSRRRIIVERLFEDLMN